MEKIQKLKLWFLSAGFRSIGWLGAFAALLLLGQTLLAGVSLGVFLSDNWITIKEIINK